MTTSAQSRSLAVNAQGVERVGPLTGLFAACMKRRPAGLAVSSLSPTMTRIYLPMGLSFIATSNSS